MKGLNNHDVMQSALCTFIYASPPPGRLGIATALLDRQLEEMPGFLWKGFGSSTFSVTVQRSLTARIFFHTKNWCKRFVLTFMCLILKRDAKAEQRSCIAGTIA